jgi:DNA-binding CsgD family transcriptional regulator
VEEVSTLVVGRQKERRVLEDAINHGRESRPSLVVVRGEAGIGKTSLVRSVTERAALDGGTVLWAPCLRFNAMDATLLPLVLAFEGWLSSTGDADVAETLDGLEGLSGLLPSRAAGGAVGPVGLLPLVGALFGRLAAIAPTVLVVDDLQWADAATRDAVTYLVAGFGSQRLTVLCTCRDESLGADGPSLAWLADLRRLRFTEEVTIERLDRAGTESLVTQLLGGEPHPGLVDDVHARSGGNPYLAELLVSGRVDSAATALPASIPQALEEALLRVWDGQSAVGRDVTRLLAVAGRPIEKDALSEVASACGLGTSESIDPALVEAVRRGVLVQTEGEVWFRHPLLVDVLVRSIPSVKSACWHAAWATRLETLVATGIEELRRLGDLAVHREAAGDGPGALEASLAAADLAHTLHASRDESLQLRRAVRLWRHRGGDDSRSDDELDLLERTANITSMVGDGLSAVEVAGHALAIADRPGADPLRLSRLLVLESELRWQLGGTDDEPVQRERRAVALSASMPDSEEHAVALASLAMNLAWGNEPEATDVADRAVAAAHRSRSPRALAEAYNSRAMVGRWRAVQGQSESDTLAGLEYARLVDNPEVRGSAALERGNELLSQGRLAEWNEITACARREMLAEGAISVAVLLGAIEAHGLLGFGRLRAAATVIQQSMSVTGLANEAAAVRLAAALHCARTGRTDAAVQHVLRARELVPSLDRRPGLEAPPRLAEVLLAQNRPREALGLLLDTMHAQSGDPRVLDDMTLVGARAAAALAERGRDIDDSDVAREAAAMFDRLGARRAETHPQAFTPGSPVDLQTTAWGLQFEAERRRCLGSPGQAQAWLEAADACGIADLRWHEHRARLAYAELALKGAGDRHTAALCLRAVNTYATVEHAEPLRRQAAALARSARVSLADPVGVEDSASSAGPLAALTPREREVLSHLVAGRTYADIAASLFISEKTVSVHVSNLLRKTGTRSRIELAERVLRLGGVGTDSEGDVRAAPHRFLAP